MDQINEKMRNYLELQEAVINGMTVCKGKPRMSNQKNISGSVICLGDVFVHVCLGFAGAASEDVKSAKGNTCPPGFPH